MAPSLCAAYTWLVLGGAWGLHHFYLGNNARAFLYAVTCGGCLGLGLLWDLCWLPAFVRVLPRQGLYEGFERFNAHLLLKFFTAWFFGNSLYLLDAAGPAVATASAGAGAPSLLAGAQALLPQVFSWVAAALGIWIITAAGLSDAQYRFWGVAHGVYLAMTALVVGCIATLLEPGAAFGLWVTEANSNWTLALVALIVGVVSSWQTPEHTVFDRGDEHVGGGEGEDGEDGGDGATAAAGGDKRSPCCCRFLALYFVAVPLFWLCAFKTFSANIMVETDAGTIKLDQLIVNVWHSEVMEDLWAELGHLWACTRQRGWDDHSCFEMLDLDGECEAYDTLELHWCDRDHVATSRPAGQGSREALKVVKAQWKTLARKYHPDKDKRGGVERMQNINAAYELLKSIYETRAVREAGEQQPPPKSRREL